MITPVELGTVVFRRGMRGYKIAEVQDFMAKITVDYENLYRENNDLKLKLDQLQSKLEDYIRTEETLSNALVLAQQTAEEQIASAKIKADIMVREAQLQAEQVRNKFKEDIQTEMQKLSWLRSQVDLFKSQFKSFLNGLLETAERDLDMKIIWEHIQKTTPAAIVENNESVAAKEAAATTEKTP